MTFGYKFSKIQFSMWVKNGDKEWLKKNKYTFSVLHIA